MSLDRGFIFLVGLAALAYAFGVGDLSSPEQKVCSVAGSPCAGVEKLALASCRRVGGSQSDCASKMHDAVMENAEIITRAECNARHYAPSLCQYE
jgi:hypothetical protein